jgi:hypothetical protein
MSALIKLAVVGAALWYGAVTVYDLPMRKLEAAVKASPNPAS